MQLEFAKVINQHIHLTSHIYLWDESCSDILKIWFIYRSWVVVITKKNNVQIIFKSISCLIYPRSPDMCSSATVQLALLS